jgi:hypothetical protein
MAINPTRLATAPDGTPAVQSEHGVFVRALRRIDSQHTAEGFTYVFEAYLDGHGWWPAARPLGNWCALDRRDGQAPPQFEVAVGWWELDGIFKRCPESRAAPAAAEAADESVLTIGRREAAKTRLRADLATTTEPTRRYDLLTALAALDVVDEYDALVAATAKQEP